MLQRAAEFNALKHLLDINDKFVADEEAFKRACREQLQVWNEKIAALDVSGRFVSICFLF